jgi:hypothetical protein
MVPQPTPSIAIRDSGLLAGGLRLEHEGQPEAREELGIDERGDLFDPFVLEREDVDRGRLPPPRLVVELEVGDRLLTTRADRNRP